jgi:hypothetical protein
MTVDDFIAECVECVDEGVNDCIDDCVDDCVMTVLMVVLMALHVDRCVGDCIAWTVLCCASYKWVCAAQISLLRVPKIGD